MAGWRDEAGHFQNCREKDQRKIEKALECVQDTFAMMRLDVNCLDFKKKCKTSASIYYMANLLIPDSEMKEISHGDKQTTGGDCAHALAGPSFYRTVCEAELARALLTPSYHWQYRCSGELERGGSLNQTTPRVRLRPNWDEVELKPKLTLLSGAAGVQVARDLCLSCASECARRNGTAATALQIEFGDHSESSLFQLYPAAAGGERRDVRK
ncbi:hypothetical protein FB451DRAFT_1191217 [Mycena latifolia]|nr:hypothetical protein FB451DRAFT_1191217 [Mycena latifolia]